MPDWLRDEDRVTGPKGRIGFAVSAPMMTPLKEAIGELGENAWRLYREDFEAWRECTVADYRPAGRGRREPLRYIAIRIQKKQGELFAGGSRAKHDAVATNLWDWEPRRLLSWHREKAGSIEALHDALNNEFAAGVCRTAETAAVFGVCAAGQVRAPRAAVEAALAAGVAAFFELGLGVREVAVGRAERIGAESSPGLDPVP